MHLARYFIGRPLSKYSNQTVFLRSNLLLHSLLRPAFYDHLLSITHEHRSKLSFLVNKSAAVNSIYLKLQEHTYTRPNCQSSWESLLNRSFPWNRIWLISVTGISTGVENDVSWKILHRVLKTSSHMKSWGFNISDKCDVCMLIEDISHVFLQCPVALSVWDHLATIFLSLLGSFSVCPSIILFHT